MSAAQCHPRTKASSRRYQFQLFIIMACEWQKNTTNGQPPSPQARYTFLCLHRHSLLQLLPFSAQILTLVLLQPPAHFLVYFAKRYVFLSQFLLSLVTATFPLYPLIGSCSFFFSLPAPLSSKTLRAVRKLKNYKEREFPDFRQTSAEK